MFQILKKFLKYINIKSLYSSRNILGHSFAEFVKSKTVFNPSTFLTNLKNENKQRQFTIGNQDDAHSFYLFCISELKKEINVEFITGVELQETTCLNCNKTTSTTAEFYDRGVRMDQEISEVGNNYKDEVDNYNCLNCKAYTQAKIVTRIVTFPTILTIYLLRFTEKRKITCSKYIPNVLRIQKYEYVKCYLILHKGGKKTSGHYTAID